MWDTKRGLSKVNSQLGSKFEVLSIEPDSLTFPYEIMTVKTVPVKLDVEISYSDGFDLLDSLILQPDSVKVIGPKKIVEKISKVKTEYIKMKDVNVSIDKKIELILDKSIKDIKLDRQTVKLTGTVEKFTEGTFDVPVKIVNLPSDIKINYFPKTVLVSYYVSLENYKNIKTLDFEIICDYAEVKNQDRTFFIPKLVSKPELVKNAKIKQNKVEFIIIE
jgi:YbbR domain-containing protein